MKRNKNKKNKKENDIKYIIKIYFYHLIMILVGWLIATANINERVWKDAIEYRLKEPYYSIMKDFFPKIYFGIFIILLLLSLLGVFIKNKSKKEYFIERIMIINIMLFSTTFIISYCIFLIKINNQNLFMLYLIFNLIIIFSQFILVFLKHKYIMKFTYLSIIIISITSLILIIIANPTNGLVLLSQKHGGYISNSIIIKTMFWFTSIIGSGLLIFLNYFLFKNKEE